MWSQDSCRAPVVVKQGLEGSRCQESELRYIEGTWGEQPVCTPYHFNNHLLPQEPPQGSLELLGGRNRGS